MSKDRIIGVRVDQDLEARLKKAAKEEDRTLSQFIRRTVAAAIEPKQQGEAA